MMNNTGLIDWENQATLHIYWADTEIMWVCMALKDL